MRKGASLLAAVTLAFSACGSAPQDGRPPQASGNGGDRGRTAAAAERTAAIYAAVVRQLITKDHTFGSGPPPFKRVYIMDGVVPDASDPVTSAFSNPRERFSEELKSSIVRSVTELPPIEFVSDARDVVVNWDECPRVKAEGALISLGPISGGARRAAVPNGLFFACLGGQWLTYVVEREDGVWEVVGTKGPVAVS